MENVKYYFLFMHSLKSELPIIKSLKPEQCDTMHCINIFLEIKDWWCLDKCLGNLMPKIDEQMNVSSSEKNPTCCINL